MICHQGGVLTLEPSETNLPIGENPFAKLQRFSGAVLGSARSKELGAPRATWRAFKGFGQEEPNSELHAGSEERPPILMTEKKWVLIGVINGVMGASLQVEGSHFATLFHAVFWYHHLDSSQKTPNKNSTKRTYTWIFQVCKICAFFHPKKLPKGRHLTYLEDPGIVDPFCLKDRSKPNLLLCFFFVCFFLRQFQPRGLGPPSTGVDPRGSLGGFTIAIFRENDRGSEFLPALEGRRGGDSGKSSASWRFMEFLSFRFFSGF